MALTKAPAELLNLDSGLTITGTTPYLVIGDAGAEDTKIVFDGNAQDYYIGLDDSADSLLIGRGATVGTTAAITVDSSSNASFSGLLTAAAKARITDVGNATVAGLQFTDAGLGISSPSTDQMNFITADTTRMVIDSSGNVGIGNTPLGTGTGQMSIRVGGSGWINAHSGSASSGQVLGFSQNAHYDSDDSWEAISTDVASNYYQGSGGHHFRVAGATTGGTDIAWINAMTMDSSGRVTMPNQPAFNAYAGTAQNNLAVAGSGTLLIFDTERFDTGGNYNTSNGHFTAPVTGKYQLSVTTRLDGIDPSSSYAYVTLTTSNSTYYVMYDHGGTDAAYFSYNFSVLADMDASDTAYVTFYQSGGSATADFVVAGANRFTGVLVA